MGVMNNRRDWMSKVDNKSEQFNDHRMFCDEAWQLLSDTCKKVNASIILSSSWRIGLTYDENRKVIARDDNCPLSTRLIEYFDKYNIKLVGITVNNWSERGQQIMEYVTDHLKIEDDFPCPTSWWLCPADISSRSALGAISNRRFILINSYQSNHVLPIEQRASILPLVHQVSMFPLVQPHFHYKSNH